MNCIVTLKNNQSQKLTNYHCHRKILKTRQIHNELWIDYKDPNQPDDNIHYRFTGKEQDTETGLYYFGARYLDPRTSRWLGVDPAMHQGDYIPSAPIDDEAKKRNGNLPGQGGIYNYVNMHVYHYAGNNPVKLVDPDGRIIVANNYAKWMFSKNSSNNYIHTYSFPSKKSNVTYYTGITSNGGRFSRTSLHIENIKYGSGYEMNKITENREIMRGDFSNFLDITNSYINAKENNGDISFNITPVEGKVDSNKEQFHLLSMDADGKKSDLFYFSSSEVKTKEQLLERIGEFFAAFQEGTSADWRTDTNAKIQSDLF